MTILRFNVALLISLVFVASVFAQGDFFFSFTEGGANIDQAMDFAAKYKLVQHC